MNRTRSPAEFNELLGIPPREFGHIGSVFARTVDEGVNVKFAGREPGGLTTYFKIGVHPGNSS
jgi:hypothetical protein